MTKYSLLDPTLRYKAQQLTLENVALADIAAQFGTPTYVYSRAALERNWQAFARGLAALPHKICYAVKANSNIGILNILQRLGSGFDIVSGGELTRVLRAGGAASNVIFSGVGKSVTEIEQALRAGIYCFNVESSTELLRLNTIAQRLSLRAPVALRINPDIDAGTHPYIATGLKENKFGIAHTEALAVFQQAARLAHIEVIGIGCHIGSQLTELAPFLAALDRLLQLVDALADLAIPLKHLDLGGGLGVCYQDETPLATDVFCAALQEKLAGRNLLLILEPGRAIVANAGLLLTRVEHLKYTPTKNFAIVDAAMNDLIRPALYDAWHTIVPVQQHPASTPQLFDIVGPVCETGDFLGKDRTLALNEHDLLAILSAGAYGFSMSSNYNTRGRAAEVVVDSEQMHLIRARETIDDLLRLETLLP